MASFLVFCALLGTGIYLVTSSPRARQRTAERHELAALRALVDRIDTLADDARDIKADPEANGYLSTQVLGEIRAHRRASDKIRFGLANAERSTPLATIFADQSKKNRERLSRSIGRAR